MANRTPPAGKLSLTGTAPTVTVAPTLLRVLDRDKAGKITHADLARLLAAIVVHFQELGYVPPEHQSVSNAPVPVELLTIIGKRLAGKAAWAGFYNNERAALAHQRDSGLQRLAERLWQKYPNERPGRIADRITKLARDDASVQSLVTIEVKSGRTRLMKAGTIRRKIHRPEK